MTSSSIPCVIFDESHDPEYLFLKAERYDEAGDFTNAFRCLLRAARRGHNASQNNLGNFYSTGKGVRRNAKNAVYWYKQAYKGGEASGAFNLALEKRNAGDIRGAIRWFQKAAALDDGDACVELAKLYRGRRGSKTIAAELLEKAQSMRLSHITENSKDEATSLLARLMRVYPIRR